jgi:hypothetical protein
MKNAGTDALTQGRARRGLGIGGRPRSEEEREGVRMEVRAHAWTSGTATGKIRQPLCDRM